MFRSSSSSLEGSTPIDMSPFHGLGGLNMFLDTVPKSISPPVSSAILSPPTTPLTPEPTMSSTQFPLLTDSSQMNMNASAAASTLLLQRQYQYHLFLQQQQQQLALAQQQLAFAASAAAANHHQKDEIAHSLKMFALLTACNADTSSGTTQDAMQEFAANGYVSDDINRFEYNSETSQHTATPQSSPLSRPFSSNNVASSSAVGPPSLPATQWMNLNIYREQLSNMWRSMSYVPNVATSSGLSMTTHKNNSLGLLMPPDHMRNISNVNNVNNNKLHKRYNNGKSKEVVTKHCVFCENNNEAEAVVNSHSVRDTYGRVLCPKLRTYVCPICGASGDSAHTIKYCPKKPIVTMEDAIKAESFRLAKSNYYKQQMKV